MDGVEIAHELVSKCSVERQTASDTMVPSDSARADVSRELREATVIYGIIGNNTLIIPRVGKGINRETETVFSTHEEIWAGLRYHSIRFML